MARADVAVVGAGLAGLTAAISWPRPAPGSRSWPPATRRPTGRRGDRRRRAARRAHLAQDAIERLASRSRAIRTRSWPTGAGRALAWLRATLCGRGLELVGEPGDPLRPIPTSIGATRLAAILPDGMAAALPAWSAGRDPGRLRSGRASATSGRRRSRPASAALRSWRGPGPARPGSRRVTVELPGLAGRHNLSGLDLARLFDDPAWRRRGLRSRSPGRSTRRAAPAAVGRGRLALPAVLGLHDHPAALAAARTRLPLAPFEVALVPAERSRPAPLRAPFGRRSAATAAGSRSARPSTGRSGPTVGSPSSGRRPPPGSSSCRPAPSSWRPAGSPAGGIVAERTRPAGRDGPRPAGRRPGAAATGCSTTRSSPAGHPLEAAGIRTDANSGRSRRAAGPTGARWRPTSGSPGSLLAGQRYLRQRCGDGVAARQWRGSRAAGRLRRAMTIAEIWSRAAAAEMPVRRPERRRVPEVQRMHDGLPGGPGHRPVPRPEIRRAAGAALPPRHAARAGPAAQPSVSPRPTSVGRLLLGLRHVHDRLPGRREDRRDEQPGPGRPAAGHRPRLRDWLLGQTDLTGRLGVLAAPLANWSLHNRPIRALIDRVVRIDRRAPLPRLSSPDLPLAARPSSPLGAGRPARRRRSGPSSTSTAAPRTTTSRTSAEPRSRSSSGTASR